MFASMRRLAVPAVVALLLQSCSDGGPSVPSAAPSVGVRRDGITNTVPGAQSVVEDSPLTFAADLNNALRVEDGVPNVTAVITVTNGTFTLGSAGGLAVSGNGTTTVTVTGALILPDGGSQGTINGALEGARFVPAPDYAGPAVLTMVSTDANNATVTSTVNITVSPVNDPPINAVPATLAGTEDAPLSFVLPITDVDIATGQLTVTLTASNSTVMTLASTAGVTITAGDGTNDAEMTLSGTLPNVNTALNGLTVTPPLNYIGQSTIEVVSVDNGNTGAGGAREDRDLLTITWASVNDAPVNTVPGPQTVTEDGTLTLTGATALSVSDVDATSGIVQVTLEATNARLTLPGNIADVTFSVGDGAANTTMTFSGTLAAVNVALATVVLTPNPNFAGTAVLTLRSNDFGNTGIGGARQDVDTVSVTVSAVNDAPVITSPGPQSTNEDVARVFSAANGNLLAISDADATSLRVTLAVTNGLLTTGPRTGLAFDVGDGVADTTMTFAGSPSNVNAALSGLAFVPTANFSGNASLSVSVNDEGTTGSGPVGSATATITINVISVNDAPRAVADAFTVAEDAAATALDVRANDSDVEPDTLSVIAVTQPTNGIATSTGTGVTYRPTPDFFGSDAFTYTLSDGNGGTAVATVSVTVTAVNDPPTVVNDSVTVLQNSAATTVSVLANDSIFPDVGETLAVTAVTQSAQGGTVAVVPGGRLVTYSPASNFTGTDTFTYTLSDGSAATVVGTVTVTVVAVNVTPVNTLPPPQQTVEDSPLILGAGSGNAITVADENSSTLTLQVSVTNGTFTLGSTTGLSTVTGNSTATVTFTGTLAALNAALENARYVPTGNFNGPATLTVTSSDSTGESDTDTLTLTVTAVNDAPVNAVATAALTVTEDVPRTFTTVLVSDVDVGGGLLSVTLTADNATSLSLSTTAGLSFTAGTGTGDTTMTFSGTLTAINSALNGLTVTPPLNYIGGSTVVMVTSDLGNTGSGGARQDTDTITLSWESVNDAPVNGAPVAQTVAEESTLVFSSANSNLLTVSDIDAAAANLQVTLSAAAGTLTLGNTAGVTFISGDGVNDATMAFSGTLTALNAALAGTSFTQAANFSGTTTITMTTTDLGNSGNGGPRQDSDVITITVTGINDAPVNTVPSAQTTNEDVARAFSVANGNPITISDVDATSLQVSLNVTNGVLTLGTRTGLTFQAGDGTADSAMTFTGPPTAINAALNGLLFGPTANFFGTATLTVLTDDLGSSGSGGSRTDLDTVSMTVTAVNDAPDAVNDAFTVAEDAALSTFSVLANDTFAPDVGETLTITSVVQPANGVVAIASGGTALTYLPNANYAGADSFTYTVSDGNGGTDLASVTVTVSSVNDAPTATADSRTVQQDSSATTINVLANDSSAPDVGETLSITAVTQPANGTSAIVGTAVTYRPGTGFTGADSFTYTISDGALTATASVVITVVAVNGTPVNTLPLPQQTLEDTPLTFSAVGGNAISVDDGNSGTLTVQVSVTNGVFTLGGTTGLTTVTGNSTPTVTFGGTLAALNTALLNARYEPTGNFNGAATLTITSSDSTGQSDTDTLTLTVAAVNDAPVNTVATGALTVTEDVPRAFTNVLVSDVDVGGGLLGVTLTADNATVLSLSTTAGLTFTAGTGTRDTAMSFSGTVIAINSALNGLTVTPPLNYIGGSTVVMITSDLGNTGSGGARQDTDTITLSWESVNDAPVNGVPGPQTVAEESTLVFSSANGNLLTIADVDASAANLQVTLSAAQGTLTLGSTAGVTFTSGDGVSDATMVFTGTITALNAALAGTSFSHAVNFAGATSVTMTTNDLGNSGNGGAKQDSDVLAITVSGVNDAPVNTVPGAQTTNEDVARAFSVANGNPITVADVDAASLQVSLSVTNGVLTTGTRVGLTFQAGDGTADSAMTFTGPPGAVNAALNGLLFAPTANFFGTATLTVLTDDLGSSGSGGNRSDLDSVAITVTSVNDAPDAVNDTFTVAEDAALSTFSLLANDTFAPDVGETLTITSVVQPANGVVAIVSGGTAVTYLPNANFSGVDSITYTVSDGNGATDQATVAVTVTPVNDAPTATADTRTVQQDSSPTTISVLANDSSAPDLGETLTITAITQPASGTSAIVGGTAVSYRPNLGFTGSDSFTYTVSDGTLTATATVSITVVAVNGTPVNTLPPPQQTLEDTALFFSGVGANAITVDDGNSATLTVVVTVTSGTFTLGNTTFPPPLTAPTQLLNNGTASVTIAGALATINHALNNARFTPNTNFNGAASLTINSSDSTGESDQDTLTLTVTAVNDPPVNTAPTALQTAIEDVPKSFNLTVADPDVGSGTLRVSLAADNGTELTLPTTTGLSFTAGTGTRDATMTFTGTLTAINAALNGFTVTPPANYSGLSNVVLLTDDQGNTGSGGARQDTDTIPLSWATDNDPPINAFPGPQTVAEEGTLTFSAAQGTALSLSDADVAAGVMQVTLAAANGRVTLGDPARVTFTTGDGTGDTTMTFRGTLVDLNAALDNTTFTPNLNFATVAPTNTLATLTMTTSDLGGSGGGARTDVDVIDIAVTPVNDAPVNTVPAAQNIQEDTFINFTSALGNLVTVADLDATTLQVTLSAQHGTVLLGTRTSLVFQVGDGTAAPTMTFSGTIGAINTALATMRFTPPANFFGTTGVVVLTRDLGQTGAGGALFDEDIAVVNVLNANDPPTATNDTFAIDEDTAGDLDVLANDSSLPDGAETLTIAALSSASSATVTIVSNRVRFVPVANFQGTSTFTYSISDGNGGTTTGSVTVTVRPLNDPPDAVNDAITLQENANATTVSVLANDTIAPDVGETLRITSVTPAASGTVLIATNSLSVSYRPNPNFVGIDTFTYTVSDGNGGVDTATVRVTVSDVDFMPVAVVDALTVVEDADGIVAVLANDTGLGDAPLTVTITQAAGRGTATLESDNRVRYTPQASFVGSDTFRYTVTDSDGDAASALVTVTVTPVDDAPVAVADTATTPEDTAVKVDVKANDQGLVDLPITLAVSVMPQQGTTQLETDGTITYTPAQNWNGTDTFTYSATDSDGDVVTAVVTITVSPVNDAPVAVADTSATRTATPVDIDVLANDQDIDGNTLTVSAATTPANGTTAVQTTGRVRYTPNAGYRGSDTFSYTVSDGNGLTATAMVVVGVGVDTDGDGLEDDVELELGTDRTKADTDGDLINDGLEVNVTRTKALDDDTDDDGLFDGNEDFDRDGVLDDGETDPLVADTDADGLLDGLEKALTAPQGEDTDVAIFRADLDPATKTDPRKPDTDLGTLKDGEEDLNANGRVDSGEKNPLLAADDVPQAPDQDRDGVPDSADNCPAVANAAQADADGNGIGDVCEPKPTGCGCDAGSAGIAPLLLGLLALRRRRRS